MRRNRCPNAIRVALVVGGFTSAVGQLVLIRELIAVFYGNELVLGLILAAWLAWVAAGAWGLGRRSQGKGALAAGLAAVTLLLPVQVALIRASRGLMGATPGALVALGPMTLTIVVVLAPLCLLLGWQFTLGARLGTGSGTRGEARFSVPLARGGDHRRGSAGSAYVAESLGGVLGGVLFSFVFVRWLDPFQTVLLVGAINLATAAVLLSARAWIPALGAIAVTVSFLPLGAWFHRVTLERQYVGLRWTQDSIYGRIVVTGQGEQRVFFENGMLLFETQGVTPEEVAHLPLLAHPEPQHVLLIGGGVSGTLAEALRHPSVQAVHYVELDPLVVIAARAELPSDQAASLDDPRVTLTHIDGRVYVRQVGQSHGGKPFDVIIVDLPEPATGQLNRFYTEEFFGEAGAILSPEGVLALGLPWQENYPGPALQHLGSSIYRTLKSRFPHILLLPGERLYLLASDLSLPTDPDVWSTRMAGRGIENRWVVPTYLEYLLTTGRVAQAQALLDAPIDVRLNRDLTPISYFYDLAVWLSRFHGPLGRATATASRLGLGWLVVPLAVATILLRRRAIPAAIGFIGLAEMALEVVILFGFQVVHGYVYGQVGLIVTAFMLGLALGGATTNRMQWPQVAPSAESAPQARSRRAHLTPRSALALIALGIALLALGLPALLSLQPPAWAFPLLALAAGGLTGMAFPLGVACTRGATGRVAGLLYGADLVGGCLGAVLASVFLVPILGIPQTCVAVAMVGIAGLIVLA